MALCFAESLLTKGGFDARDQMNRYRNWWHWGYLSSTGSCFDIGSTVRDALTRFEATGEPYSGSEDPQSAGNGSLMRLAPIALFSFPDLEAAVLHAASSSRTTHGAPEAVESCELLAAILCRALSGMPKDHLLHGLSERVSETRLRDIAQGKFIAKEEAAIRGSGYCVQSLEAALWSFWYTDSFEAAVLRAANLGEDADTTAAIVGQLAGAYYGVAAIPAHWLEKLSMCADIRDMAIRLYELGPDRHE
jgi:ADP-ribosyl-[dinitrogen reductase] hydrolase